MVERGSVIIEEDIHNFFCFLFFFMQFFFFFIQFFCESDVLSPFYFLLASSLSISSIGLKY